MTYMCLHQNSFDLDNYCLTTLRHQDIMNIKNWRNDQIAILRQQVVLTDEMQELYYSNIVLPSFTTPQPKQILFSYLFDGHCIGYGGFVHIDWIAKRAEVSFLLDTQRAQDPSKYHKDFTVFLKLLKQIGFQYLHFNRLYTETFDIRPLHISILEEQGFSFEGRLKKHVLIEGKLLDSLIHGCVV